LAGLHKASSRTHRTLAVIARPISAGCLATARGVVLSEDDRVRGAIIERLMCDFSVDLEAFASGTMSLTSSGRSVRRWRCLKVKVWLACEAIESR